MRSVSAAELHALTYGFGNAFVIREVAAEIIGRRFELEVYVDSKTFFELVAKDTYSYEKRLQIDIHGIRESYTNGEVTRFGWISVSESRQTH